MNNGCLLFVFYFRCYCRFFRQRAGTSGSVMDECCDDNGFHIIKIHKTYKIVQFLFLKLYMIKAMVK